MTDHFLQSTNFGHPIHIDADEYTIVDGRRVYQAWRYDNTNELVKQSPERQCPKCHKYATEEGHDPCIANLPGVKFACCGHGRTGSSRVGSPYVIFEDHRETLKGSAALKFFKEMTRPNRD